ncbi:hypothetical protein D3C81_1754950 [compost metagenome]
MAYPPQPGLAPGEFKVQAPAALAHGFVGDRVGEGQRGVQPAPLKSKGVVRRAEPEGARESIGIAGVILGPSVFETRTEQRQRAAQQVVTDDFQRHQAELGIESGQRREVAIFISAKPDALAIVYQA